MTLPVRTYLFVLTLSLVGVADLEAQAPPPAPSVTASNASVPATPPQPPVVKSPVAIFRELLAMTPEQRREQLADRSPESRELILAKVREYKSLKPEQRELRLKATELRWYLLPLMKASPADWPAQLALVPAEDRKLVADRLKIWESLSSGLQQQLLTNEVVIRYLTELGHPKQEISPARQQFITDGITRWQKITEEERQKLIAGFKKMFELNPQEQARTLSTLSEEERHQIEKTLMTYKELSPAQRGECIRSFEKFTSLSVEERQQFLKNAERWKLLKPAQREAWRNLVNRLQSLPPLPPGLNSPPLPPGLRRTSEIATSPP